MLRWSVALVTLVVAGLIPARVRAQDASSARDSAIAHLRTGQQIRLTAAGLGRLSGRAGVPAGDSLDLAQGDAVRRIPIPAIDTLWVRGGSSKTGAIVGAVSLVALSFIVRAAWNDYCESDCTPTATEVVGGIVVSGALGASLGAIIGGAIPKWKRKYP